MPAAAAAAPVLQRAERWGGAGSAQELVDERARSDRLLHQMLPPAVADGLRAGQRVEAKPYPQVTILFSDIVGFSTISRASTPAEVVVMLDELYNRFDSLCDLPEFKTCYKVETIGDAVRAHPAVARRRRCGTVRRAAVAAAPPVRTGVSRAAVRAGHAA